MNDTVMISQNARLTGLMLFAAMLLSIPYAAMQLSVSGVRWKWFDFLVAGFLLFGTGLLIELALRTFTKLRHRILLCAAILLGLFVVWAELAVGIIGTPLAGS